MSFDLQRHAPATACRLESNRIYDKAKQIETVDLLIAVIRFGLRLQNVGSDAMQTKQERERGKLIVGAACSRSPGCPGMRYYKGRCLYNFNAGTSGKLDIYDF